MNRILALFFMAFLITFSGESLSRVNEIHIGTPSSYNVVEHFFGNANCHLLFPPAYLYDRKKQRFLSYSESVARLPEQYKIFSRQQCNFSVTNDSVAEALGLNWVEGHELVVLFFEPPKEVIPVRFSGEDNIYKRNLRLFKSIEELPLYKIKVPFTGFNPQR